METIGTDANTNPMQGRWLREATEKELKWLTKVHSAEAQMCEWGWAGQTYWLFERHSAIVRSNILGGSIVDIHGGWIYPSPLHARLDWQEILRMGSIRALDN